MTTRWVSVPWLAGLLAALVIVASAPLGRAAEKKADKGTTVQSKGAKGDPAAADLTGLGLELDGLKSLQGRIESARSAHDPVALASAAKELAAVESVAGKMAATKSADLIKEAIEMAKYRNRPNELKIVAKLVGGAQGKELVAQADKVAQAQEARSKQTPEERGKGIKRNLAVKNFTRFYIDIYVNDIFQGTVAPFSTKTVYVGDDSYDSTKLFGKAPGTDHIWGPRYVTEPVVDVAWSLDE